MIEENAFGVLVSWYDIEESEYGMEPEEFAGRWCEFANAWQEALTVFQLGTGAEALDLGHALYVEIGDGDQNEDPIVWLKMVRARIAEKGFTTVGVVSHGGRFRELPRPDGDCPVPIRVASPPSEALRRALFAETACHEDEELAPDGWGPGIYVDSEAIEALGRQLKNAPTPLASGGATFFRVAR